MSPIETDTCEAPNRGFVVYGARCPGTGLASPNTNTARRRAGHVEEEQQEAREGAAKTTPTADPDLVPLMQMDKEKKGAAKKPKAAKASKEKNEKKMSRLDAAAAVLKEKDEPMQCKAMVEAMFQKKLWHSDAPTPAATLSSAILREMKKGKDSRFKKTGRGQFALNV